MASEFSTEFFSANRIVKADLQCRPAPPPRTDLERIKKEVAKLYDATEVILNVTVDDSLLSGYVLQIGDRVFDNSGRHAIDQMMADKPSLATLRPASRTTSPPPPAKRAVWSSPPPTASWKWKAWTAPVYGETRSPSRMAAKAW